MIKPPKAIDYPDKPLDCEMALEPVIINAADQALQMGWGHQEIATAIMEVANNWYFAQAEKARTEQAIDLARAAVEVEKK